MPTTAGPAARATPQPTGAALTPGPPSATHRADPTVRPTPATHEPTRRASGRRRRFTALFNGDMLLHDPLWYQAERDAPPGKRYDFEPMLADLAPTVRSVDLAIAHLETPAGRPDGPFSSYPTFQVPPQILTALRHTGYRGITTASNHSLDAGFDGIRRTLDAADAAGLRHAGTARSSAEARRPAVFEVSGTRVALLSYAYGFNGYRLPAGQPWAANLIDVSRIRAAAAGARRAGAHVVVVAVHAGDQYVHEPNAQQLQVFDELTADDAIDFVYGHHAHVVQPVTRVNGKWVAYGVGNAVTNNEPQLQDTRQGLSIHVTFTPAAGQRLRVTHVGVIPTYMTVADPFRWLDARHSGRRISADLADELSLARKDVRSDAGGRP